MGLHRSKLGVFAALMLTCALIAAACGGGGEEATDASDVLGTTLTTATTSPTSTTAQATTVGTTPTTGSTTTQATTTTTGATTTTQAPTTTQPTTTTILATILAATFEFAGGPGPKFDVAADVGPTVDGPWQAAVEAAKPQVDTPEFFVRFRIQNLDTLGYMTELNVSSSVLGQDLCAGVLSDGDPLVPDVPAGTPGARAVCVAGPFPTQAGEQAVPFSTPENAGYRQGDDRGFFDQGIFPAAAVPGENVFTFYFEPPAGSMIGKTVIGHTPAASADFGIGLFGPVAVDCSDRFTGSGGGYSDVPTGSPNAGNGDPAVVAFSITSYDAGGSVTAQCLEIPRFDDPFDAVDGPDNTAHYQGVAAP